MKRDPNDQLSKAWQRVRSAWIYLYKLSLDAPLNINLLNEVLKEIEAGIIDFKSEMVLQNSIYLEDDNSHV